MNAKIIKIAQIVAATTFLAALVINISVTLTDPFVMMSDEAVAQTTSTGTTTGTGTGTPPEIECLDVVHTPYDTYILSILGIDYYCTASIIECDDIGNTGSCREGVFYTEIAWDLNGIVIWEKDDDSQTSDGPCGD